MIKNNNVTKKFTNPSNKKYIFFLFVANASCTIETNRTPVAFLLKGRYCLACSIPLFFHSKTKMSMLKFQACIFINFQSPLFPISLSVKSFCSKYIEKTQKALG